MNSVKLYGFYLIAYTIYLSEVLYKFLDERSSPSQEFYSSNKSHRCRISYVHAQCVLQCSSCLSARATTIGRSPLLDHTLRFRLPNVVVEYLARLLRIREVLGSNVGPETGYPDFYFRDFPQSLQASAGTVP
jgi:hypothetical protein